MEHEASSKELSCFGELPFSGWFLSEHDYFITIEEEFCGDSQKVTSSHQVMCSY